METCRVCLTTGYNLHSVWDMIEDRLINDLIGLDLQIEIRADHDLPQSICCSCLKVLKEVHKLRQVAQRNESIIFESDGASSLQCSSYYLPAHPMPLYDRNYVSHQPQPSSMQQQLTRAPSSQQDYETPSQQENFQMSGSTELNWRASLVNDTDSEHEEALPLRAFGSVDHNIEEENSNQQYEEPERELESSSEEDEIAFVITFE